MRATIVHVSNPFAPARSREIAHLNRPMRVSTWLRRRGIDPVARRTVCQINGEWVLRRDWGRRTLRDGDHVTFVDVPAGGGGGSNPLRVILAIAVIVAAVTFGPQFGAMLLPNASPAVQGAVGTALISVGGSMLVNAVIPPPRLPAASQMADLAAASPTYNLQAQGNQARLGAAIPAWYGRNQIYPDFAAQPYAEFSGNEQMLYQLFVIGQGAYSIEAIRIEDTPITSFAEVTTEVVEPGGTVTLFPTSVVTSVEVTGQEALSSTVLGPFVANAAGTTINAIAIDMVAPAGLYYANDGGGLDSKSITWQVETQSIDNAGVPLGAWATLGTESLSGATTTPQRVSHRYTVAAGRYQVRLTRTDTKDTSSRAGHTLTWAGLRGYLPGTQQYGQITVLAIRMRASNQLSGLSSRKVNVIATRKLPIRSAGAWTAATATTSIAWAAADALRDIRYGAGLADAQIDIAGLEALDATWTSRGDGFSMGFDSTGTLWEALTIIGRAGRAVPVIQGGVVRFMRDGAASLPVTMFSMRNIVPGTFGLDYRPATADMTDAVEVEFWDSATFSPRTVTAILPSDTSARPARVKLPGVTSRGQAWREGMYMAASNLYRRKFASWQTELEGHIVTYGDLVAVQFDAMAYGQVADATAWVAGTRTLTVDQDMTWGVGTHYVALRRPNGAYVGPIAATRGAADNVLVLASDPGFTPEVGTARERTHVMFGLDAAADGQPFDLYRVTAVRPRGQRVEISAVIEDARVHTADSGSAPAGSTWTLPTIPTVPVIPGALAAVAGGTVEAPTLSVSWTPAPGADYYVVEHSVDGTRWTPRGDVSGTSIVLSVPAGTNYVRVAPVGLTQGAWVVWTGSVQGGANIVSPPALTGLTATGLVTAILLEWADPAVLGGDRYEILRNTTNDPGGAQVIGTTIAGPARLYVDTPPSMTTTYWYWVRLINTRGEVGALSSGASAAAVNPTPGPGSIGSTELADGAVTTAKVAAGAIVAAKIAAGTITADKMAANSITAANAAIEDAAITTAKIQDAQITTLKIAGQAVTIPVSAFTATGVALSGPLNTETVLQTCVIQSSGAPILVAASCQTNNGLAVRLKRNGVTLYQANLSTITSIAVITPQISDQPGAGTHTYQLIGVFQATATVSNRSLLLLETKR